MKQEAKKNNQIDEISLKYFSLLFQHNKIYKNGINKRNNNKSFKPQRGLYDSE